MDRRGFFGTLAALCAAPAALFRAPKAKVDDSKSFTGSTGVLNTFELKPYPHECEWRDLPMRTAQQCLVCGDVRSRLKYVQDVLDRAS